MFTLLQEVYHMVCFTYHETIRFCYLTSKLQLWHQKMQVLSQITLKAVFLSHQTFVCYQVLIFNLIIIEMTETNLQQTEQSAYDESIDIQLPFKKIKEIIMIGDCILLICFGANQYAVVKVKEGGITEKGVEGCFPKLAEQITIVSNTQVLLIQNNQLHLFSLPEGSIMASISIPLSTIHSETFSLAFCKFSSRVLFYKTSIFRTTQVAEYDGGIWQLPNFKKQKRIRCEYHGRVRRKLGLALGQAFSYQVSGYQIQVIFLDSEIHHKISSIYPLFLIDIHSLQNQIVFQFSHSQLQNELVIYSIDHKKVKKLQRRPRSLLWNHSNELHGKAIVKKSIFWSSKQNSNAQLKIRIRKESKYIGMLEFESISQTMKQTILELLQS